MVMDVEKFRRDLKSGLKKSEESFKGKYAAEINGLLALSREEIDKITPDATDLATYDRLIILVKAASASNIRQAELKKAIIELGETAMVIAQKVPSLAKVLV